MSNNKNYIKHDEALLNDIDPYLCENSLTTVRNIEIKSPKTLQMNSSCSVNCVQSNSENKSKKSLLEILEKTTVYDIIPTSSKIIILDINLKVKKAFYALIAFEMRGAILWNSALSHFEGMFTITDFIHTLLRSQTIYHDNIQTIEEQRISTWRELCSNGIKRTLHYVDMNTKLYEAFQVLHKNHIHRLPIFDSVDNNPLFILTHKRILHYIGKHLCRQNLPELFFKTIFELKIGTFENIKVINYSTSIEQVLNIFINHSISALPIVDDNNKLIDIYSKSDVVNLVHDRAYTRLNTPISSCVLHRQLGCEGVLKCTVNDTFKQIFERIVEGRVHRLVIVDNENTVIGILSLSDILKFLLSDDVRMDLLV